MSHSPFREAVINLDALAANVAQLKASTGSPNLLIVVKANAYGHGMVECAGVALAGGANWLGVADIDEALELRAAGFTAPILAWLHAPDETFVEALAGNITLGVSSVEQLRACVRAAEESAQGSAQESAQGSAQGHLAQKQPARVHLKLETGLARNGASESKWAELFAEAASQEAAGSIVVEGIFSHLSNTSEGDDLAQGAVFDRGVLAARAAGLTPTLVHLAASATALTQPTLRYNMVRIGILAYGVSPFTARTPGSLGLTPVMTLRATVAAVRRVPADQGVSYDYTYRTTRETTLALVPLGYGEGIPRAASGLGPVVIGGERFTVAGRVAMDQFIVDVGDAAVFVGDEVVLFGDPTHGYPSVTEWADAASTIGYEMVTRMGGRLQRTFVGLG